MKRPISRNRRIAAACGGLAAAIAGLSSTLTNSQPIHTGEFLRGMLLGLTLVFAIAFFAKWMMRRNSGSGLR